MIDLTPVVLSLKTALLATAISFVLGVALARLMTRYHFPGKGLLELFFSLPLVLPPTVIGFGLLMLFGNNGILGKGVQLIFHRQVVFTWVAAVIASTVVAFPLMYRSARAAFEGVDPRMELAARTLGATEWKIFYTISLPLARYGILAGLVMSFARALGEFGATLMVAGNIPGKTQTLPLAIYFALEAGDKDLAGSYVAIIVVLSLLAVILVNRWTGSKF